MFKKKVSLQPQVFETIEFKLTLIHYPDTWHVYSESAGYEDGNYCIIEVNGNDLCKNTRGHNIVVINPVKDTIVSRAFDTWQTDDYVTSAGV